MAVGVDEGAVVGVEVGPRMVSQFPLSSKPSRI